MSHETVQPALIIGLGGSGIDIVRRFKRRFATLYPDVPYVRLLGIDTAPQVPVTQYTPPLEDDEFIYAAGFNMTYHVGVGHIDNHPTIRDWWRGYDLPLKTIQQGAGQRRPVGRLAFFVRQHEIAERLRLNVLSIFNDDTFRRLPEHYRKAINIYVVASTCGGTGTGMILDLAYLAQDVSRRWCQV